MPSRSRAQHNYFEWLQHDPEARRREGVSEETARDYTNADKRNKNWKKRQRVQKAVIDLLLILGRSNGPY